MNEQLEEHYRIETIALTLRACVHGPGKRWGQNGDENEWRAHARRAVQNCKDAEVKDE